MRTAIVWFRRDLRLADHPALRAAADGGACPYPVYIHAPEEETPWAPGAASRWWLHHSLAALDGRLRKAGSRLDLRRGPTGETLLALARATGAESVHWNRLHEPALATRDAALRRGLEAEGLEVREHDAALYFPPPAILNAAGEPYRVFTPFWRSCRARLDEVGPPLPAPRRLPAPPEAGGSLTLASLGLLPRVRWDEGLAEAWTPGEAAAQRTFDRFLESRVARYARRRDLPGEAGTSRLSPHLHFGELTPRQLLAELREAGGKGAETFLRELGWREFAAHLLHHFPHTTDEPLDARFAGLDWRRDEAELRAWQRGRTGLPIVDAGMRELWATGWMHNRVRMIVASLLTKNLFMHWREGARWFWDTLVDADLANNTLGWQWTAGCGADAAPYFRIFNPVLQSKKFDPRGDYLRRWLPELAALPDRWLHEPWSAPAGVQTEAGFEPGADYPAPLVDLKASRARALERFERLKQA